MGNYYAPEPVTRGLVFNWDMNNQKSYKGPLIQNICQVITPVATSGTNIAYTTGSIKNVKIPSIGIVSDVPYVDGYNSNSASYCCLNQFYFGNNNGTVSCSPSTTYTYSIVYKCTSNYSTTNYMYRFEYTSGDVYVTEAGIHNDNNRIHLGDGWYWAWGTFTTSGTTAKLRLGFWYYQYNVSDRVYIAKALVTPGNYTGLHPRLWPDLNTTRVATRSIYDLLGSSSVSAAALSYDSSGYPTFDGANNYIRWNNNTALDTQAPTVEVWVKINSLTQNGFFFEKGAVNTQYSLFFETFSGIGYIIWRQALSSGLSNISVPAATYINTSSWVQIVGTYVSGSSKIYINGVLVTSGVLTGSISTNNSGMFMGEYGGGGYRYNGNIGIVRVYNRNLTDQEILRNFNVTRTRFGI